MHIYGDWLVKFMDDVRGLVGLNCESKGGNKKTANQTYQRRQPKCSSRRPKCHRSPPQMLLHVILTNGGVGERLKPAVLKTCRKKSARMFSIACKVLVGAIRHNSGGVGVELGNSLDPEPV